MKVAIVGATGMVGRVMLRVLEERKLPIDKILLVASSRSVGKKITYRGKPPVSYTHLTLPTILLV